MDPLKTVAAYLQEQGVEADPFYRVPFTPRRQAPGPSNSSPKTAPRTAPQDMPVATEISGHDALLSRVARCQACGLAARRKKAVRFGGANPPSLALLTDLPEFYDEQMGRFFTDAPGELVRKMVEALEVPWSRIWLTGALKCHSSVTLGPRLDPYRACLVHLEQEMDMVKPPLILAFGEATYRLLFDPGDGFDWNVVRGKALTWKGIPIRFTHHPRELIMDPTLKKESWENIRDLKGRIS